MSIARVLWAIDRFGNRLKIAAIPLLVLAELAVFVLVYQTGGIKYVYAHSMYLPILGAALLFGVPGGMVAGLVGGLLLGPLMPVDVATGEAQPYLNWMYRLGFFVLIGTSSGAVNQLLFRYIRRMRWSLHHNSLTGLPNQAELARALDRVTAGRGNSIPSAVTLALFYLENIEETEVTFGSRVTEAILTQLATRLREYFPASARVYHPQPCQLVVLVFGWHPVETVSFPANMQAALLHPYQYRNISVHVDIGFGFVALNKTPGDTDLFLRRAQVAISQRPAGHLFNMAEISQVSRVSRKNLALLGSLQRALERDQLLLHYQPKMELDGGTVIGVEALLRWYHPHWGMVPPGAFIPRAEQSSLIDPLTDWVLDSGLRQLADWHRQGRALTLAVNVSPRNLISGEFVQRVASLLRKHAIRGEWLELEVTEGALIVNLEESVAQLKQLTELGIEIAIDDFGTGYSSLQYLNRLPAATVKLDQSFVRELGSSPGALHIIDAGIRLAHSLGMKVVAEGVEDHHAYLLLLQMGCDMVQGYYISAPLPPEGFLSWLADRQPATQPVESSLSLPPPE